MLFSRTSQRRRANRARHLLTPVSAGMAVVALAIGMVVAGLGSAALAAEDPEGVDISIDVLGPPAATPPATPPPTPPRGNTPRGGTVTQETISLPTEADAALGDEPFDLGGVLYVSGLTGSASPTLHPDNGVVKLKITVRNTSETSFDSSLRFWLENAVGAKVAEVKGVRVKALEPGETRTITASMRRLGQWTMLHAHATLTPPKVVDGTALVPLTRDTVVTLPPLFGLSIGGALGVLGGLIWWALRFVRLRP